MDEKSHPQNRPTKEELEKEGIVVIRLSLNKKEVRKAGRVKRREDRSEKFSLALGPARM